MEFHLYHMFNYDVFRKFRFIGEFKTPDKIYFTYGGKLINRKPIPFIDFAMITSGDFGELSTKYTLTVNENSVCEIISAGIYTFELHTFLKDVEKEEFVSRVLAFHRVMKTGFVPRVFDDYYVANECFFSILADEVRKGDSIFQINLKSIYLKENPKISVYLQGESDGHYHFYSDPDMEIYKEKQVKLVEHLHNLIQKQKIRVMVGLK